MAEGKDAGRKTIATNRKALHEYFVVDRYEAGVALVGTEVKSVRDGRVNFQDAHAYVKQGEVWLAALHISPYSHGNRENHDPTRKRKLLLNRREILKLDQRIKEKGMTIVPLSVYLKNGLVKVELGLCKGKKLHDKRDTIAERDARRDADRALREKY